MTKMLLFPSFRGPLVLLLSPYGDSKMARNGFEDGSKWYATGYTCSSANEAESETPNTCSRGDEALLGF